MNSLLPRELQHYLEQQLIHRVHPLCLVTDESHCLTQASGDLAFYGLTDLALGASLDGPFPWLAGTTTGLIEPLELAFMTMEPTPGVQRTAHVHLVPLPGGLGIILLDASAEQAQRQVRQQAANELALLHQQRERLLAELEQSRAQLEESNRQLEAAGHLKSLFIGSMSHEFRTPLTSILGYLDLRHHEEMNADHLDAIEGAARHLLTLVENLLDQARLENDELELYPGETDIREIVDVVRQMFSRAARQQGLAFSVEMNEPLPARVLLDGMRLRQILINLIGNAFKFTVQGTIRVNLEWRSGRLAVSVSDSGTGISTEDQQRIFEPFRQAQRMTARHQGAGLGLAITLALVQRMGGQLRLDSRLGMGSRFHFEVDACEIEQMEPARKADNRVLLIVEDDPDIQALLGAYLEGTGYTLAFAADGATALALITDATPDAMLMDMHLPDMMGPDIIRAARQAGYDGPAVILSAAASQSDRDQAVAAGISAYLAKPIDPIALLQTVSNLG